jgi:predicted TIM-barrel fold metal-dependent hydrolase
MDKGGVATAFLSVTEPGLWYGDEFEKERQEAISMARDINEFGARMVADYKGRFGLFAVLPLPDVEASLREIEYAFDTLKADGVGLLTSYGNLWLGDPKFHPVFDELNRRGAVVFSHPTDATCCHNLANANPATLEWFTDTTRSILSVIAAPPSRTGRPPVGGSSEGSLAARCPNIKFIWSHAGGTLIGAVSRVVGNVTAETLARPADPNSRLHHVRRFYYDTAGSANPIAMQGITKLVGISQIVFGSDYPWGTSLNIAQGLEACGLSYPELRAIDRENVVRFMPKYT